MAEPVVRTAQFGEPNRVSVDDMLHEIANQSVAVSAVIEQVNDQLRSLDSAVFKDAQHVFITGCGDSYFAGLAARLAFLEFGGVHTEAIEALEYSRYVADFTPPNSVVFSISNSGKAARSVEAALRGGNNGAFTVAVTGNPAGWLASASDVYLDQAVKADGKSLTMPSNLDGGAQRASFGLANYLASLTTLYLVAIHFGRVRDRITDAEAERLTEELRGMPSLIDKTVELNRTAALQYAEHAANVKDFTIVGAGPGYATALFYGAKTYELARVNGAPQELEEWAHEQFFITRPGTQAIFVAQPGRAYSRTLELLDTAKTMGATNVVVTDEAGQKARERADFVLPVAGSAREAFMALPYCVPGELFATFLTQQQGRDAFEFDSDTQYIMNMRTIQESRVYATHSQALDEHE